jgi:hypothetical protein
MGTFELKKTLGQAFCCALLMSAIAPSASAQNALATLAASLPVGSWQELTTTNIGALNQSGTDGHIIPYGGDAAWDAGSRKLLFVGNDHIDSIMSEADRFVIYSADTNAWRNMAPPPWSSAGMTDHGYYEHAADGNGHMYRRANKSGRTFGIFDIASETWSSTAADNLSSSSCCSGADWFPELGGMIHVQGGEPGGGVVRLYNASTGQWSGLASNLAPLTDGTFTYAAYNSVAKLMIFGQKSAAYKLTSSGAVSQIASSPNLYDGSGYLGSVIADPVSGEFVALTATGRTLYVYNVSTDTWETRATTNMPNLSGYSVIGAPVPNYGVILYVTCKVGSCKTWVYKHQANGPPGPPPAVPNSPSAVSAN